MSCTGDMHMSKGTFYFHTCILFRYTSEFDAAVETTFTELGTDNAVAISYLHQMTAFTTLPVKYNRVCSGL